MSYKPVDTAIVMIVGPCIDNTDFKSLEEAIAYDAAGMDVSLIVEKTDGTTAVTAITLTTAGTSDWTHKDGGYYEVEITAAQNAEEGIAYVRGVCTGVLPFESIHYNVVKANVYDSWIKGTDVLQTDVTQWLGTAVTANVAGQPTVDVTRLGAATAPLIDLVDFASNGYDSTNNVVFSDLVYIHGSALTETAGQLAAGFTKLFDVATPLLVASDVMRGTDNAALAATALTDVTWTDAKAAFLDHSIATVDTNVDTLLTRITAARAGYLDNLSAGAVALASALATAQTDLDIITGVDGVTLATLQALYAPNKVVPDVAGTAAGLHSTTDGKIDTVDTNVDSILLDTGTNGVLLAATATSAQLVDDVWDEILSGTTHNIATSAGRRVREIGAYAIQSGTAQAGNSIHITLAATASATDGIYNRNLLVIVGGTGAGQTRTIVDYVGSTKVALADREWRVSPDATSEYQVVPDDTPLVVDHGLATAGTVNTITLRSYASAVDSIYNGAIIAIIAGTGRGESRIVESYVGATRVATVCDNWDVTPDTTSVYVMMPYGMAAVVCIGADPLADIKTQADDALTDYGPPTRTEATADKDAIITEVNANETKIDALNDITVADIIAGVADGSYDLQEMMRIIFAALSGKSSGGGTTTLTFQDPGDAKARITATVNSSGDRTAMTLDAT